MKPERPTRRPLQRKDRAVRDPVLRAAKDQHDNPNVHTFLEKFKTESLIQFGGKGTTGLGYCTVKIID